MYRESESAARRDRRQAQKRLGRINRWAERTDTEEILGEPKNGEQTDRYADRLRRPVQIQRLENLE